MAPLIDADAHIEVALTELSPFMDQPWRHRVEAAPTQRYLLPRDVGEFTVGGRIKRPAPGAVDRPPVAADLRIVFPTKLLNMGLHPSPQFDAAVAAAYARWVTEVYLPEHPADRAMLYLPLRDVDACRRMVAECGGRPGVAGVYVTNAGFPQVHDNAYVGLYADLEERGLPLGFHPTSVWLERPLEVFDRYLGVYALGYPFYQCVHVINWVLHGMPERFPHLRCVFYETGVTWISFIAHRLDQEFMKRPSEAPLVRDRPSHYMARFFYTTQPLDRVEGDDTYLESVFRLVGPQQFLYASNYPQWDFDVPDVIARLGFLTAAEQQAVLSENARQLFQLPVPVGR